MEVKSDQALHVLVQGLFKLVLLEELIANFPLVFNPLDPLRESLSENSFGDLSSHGTHFSIQSDVILVGFDGLFLPITVTFQSMQIKLLAHLLILQHICKSLFFCHLVLGVLDFINR